MKELASELEQSAAKHNALVGAIQELQELHKKCLQEEAPLEGEIISANE